METQNEYLFDRGSSPLRFESVCDYVLPDYNTDVKRVLFTKARAIDSGCYIGDDAVDVSGVVDYEVVYLDSDNELTSCKFSTDFDSSQRCNGASAIGAHADTRIVGFSLRPVGPRKFSAKAQLSSTVNLTERGGVSVDSGAFSSGDAEVKTKLANIAYRAFFSPTERSYSATILSLDGVIADDVLVLYSNVTPEIVANVADGGVALSGLLRLVVLLEREGEVPTALNYEFAIDELLPMDDMPENSVPTAYGRVGGLRIETLPTENGVELVASFTVEYSASAIGNKSHSVILDGYLTDRDVENTYDTLSYTEHIASYRLSEELSLCSSFADLGTEPLRDILLSDASMRVDEVTVRERDITIGGMIRITGVACQTDDDGTLGYVGIKADLPFTMNASNTNIPPEARVFFHGDVCAVFGAATADGARFTVRVAGMLEAMLPHSLTRLSSSEACADPIESGGSVITVYYPAAGETLFDVGRKFHTRTLEIAANNSLTEDVFAADGASLLSLGVSQLLIM